MKLTPQFYIISDLHFGHANIVKYQERPEKFDWLIIKNWNKVVTKKDKVLMLGDLSLTNQDRTKQLCWLLNGKKYMLRGNHDGHSDTWFRDCDFTVVEPIYKVFKDKYDKRYHVLFTHEPIINLPKGWFNIHGHIHRGIHRSPDLIDRHFNMCVEVLNYKPKPLYEILTIIFNLKGGEQKK